MSLLFTKTNDGSHDTRCRNTTPATPGRPRHMLTCDETPPKRLRLKNYIAGTRRTGMQTTCHSFASPWLVNLCHLYPLKKGWCLLPVGPAHYVSPTNPSKCHVVMKYKESDWLAVGLEKKLAVRSSARAWCGSARLGAARELGTSRAEPLFKAR